MSTTEQKLHIDDISDIYIQIAKKYDHSAICIRTEYAEPGDLDMIKKISYAIREKSGDEYCVLKHGDPTFAIPSGSQMMDFSVQMLEEPEKLHEKAKRRVEQFAMDAEKLNQEGHFLDGFVLCSDYCFNINPFFTVNQFDEFIVPYLKEIIDIYRSMGYYTIKHTDGNIMPIVKMIADCNPHAIHSLDPQGGVNLREVRKIVGNKIALAGNVNCGLLQTGTEGECDTDVRRSLREGMEDGKGYVFSTSNCVYTGMPLERYERMWRIWREYGVYN